MSSVRRLVSLLVLALTLAPPVVQAIDSPLWVGTWASAPVAESAAKDATPLAGATLRQVVHVSIGGPAFRVRFSNVFGNAPLVFQGAHVALAAAGGDIRPATDRPLLFAGRTAVTIPPGASYVSDPVDLALPPQADVAISVGLLSVPGTLTMHGGSRTTSYLQPGAELAAASWPGATTFTRWYFINAIEVATTAPSAAFVMFGDSITDGYGIPPDSNQRLPDVFARRLQARAEGAPVGVLNLGLGGNRLLRDGLGPNALARFDRDVLAQSGVRWVLVFEGINDIGTRLDARKKGSDYASAADIIAALEQLVARARGHGLRVIGATITPYQGADFYWSPDGEADRQTVNTWIRTSGRFDCVADFDAALRDPAAPTRLAAAYDSGDHLHPSVAGYRRLADELPLAFFRQP